MTNNFISPETSCQERKSFKNKIIKHSIFSNTQQQNLKLQARDSAVDRRRMQQLLPSSFTLHTDGQIWDDL